MAEETEKQRRAEPKDADKKAPARSSGNAQSSGRGASGPRSSSRDGPRPSGPRSGDRPQGDRPYKPREGGAPRSGDRPQGDRPFRPRDGSSPSSGSRPQGDRPYKPREGGAPRSGDRPQGDRPFRTREGAPSAGGPRPQGDRPQYRDSKFSSQEDDDAVRGLGKDTGTDETDSAPAGVKMAVRLPRKNDDYSRSYRGTSARATSGQRNGPNKQGRHGKAAPGAKKQFASRQPMLSMHKVTPFKYDMNQILMTSSMDPSMASGFLATIVAKASRVSIKDAKEYIGTFLEAGNITKDEHDKFCKLLDRYSKYR
ncbi:hypothetical protein TALC_00269 [Thermoplasmatales archaeon BRNA1]|nr:hypothetical protein TALC_00269 [Thermoplasmatales archaeon BRNA1]